ncbi:type II/IV secretion system ATPase subunit [Candidatus Altiarchaeota archaeon]
MSLKAKAENIRGRGVLHEALIRHVRAYGEVDASEVAKTLKADGKDMSLAIDELKARGMISVRKGLFSGTKIRATKKLLSKCITDVSRADLLDLIEVKRSLTLGSAALRLNVTSVMIAEWTGLLEDEGLVKRTKNGFHSLDLNILRYRLNQRLAEKVAEGRVIQTQVDYMYDALCMARSLTIRQLASITNTDPGKIEDWAKKVKAFKLSYPTNITKEAIVTLAEKKVQPDKETGCTGSILDSYKITADKVTAKIRIISTKQDSKPIYEVSLPNVGHGTECLMDSLRDELSVRIRIDPADISDHKKMIELKGKFYREAKKILQSELELDEDDINILSGMMTHSMYGLGDIELLMHDDWLEEVCINTSHVPLTAFHKRFGWVETNLKLADERAIYNYAAQIGRKVERDITNMEPIMDAHLLSGDRVNATLFPISTFGNTITIRKFARQPWTITHFLEPGMETLSPEMAAFLWMCFQYELNVIVGGGTASGKTSMLNCLCALIQPTHRIITIEDTRELNLPKYLRWNWVPLTTRDANPEGRGEVSMLDLIVTSLRMRPDRIVLGEIRRRGEAEVLFEAMHTGHSVYGTIHADNVNNLKRRLLEPPIELPPAEVEALHLMIVVYRDRKRGFRKVFEIAEVRPGNEGMEFELNYLFRYNARTQEFLKINESIRILDELSLHTGMAREEIYEELKEKELVLEWLVDNKKKDLDEVGEIIDLYYKNKDELMEMISGKDKKDRK